MGDSGRSSEENFLGVSRLLLTVKDVAPVELDSILPFDGPDAKGFFLSFPFCGRSWASVDCLLLSDEDMLRSSDPSFCV